MIYIISFYFILTAYSVQADTAKPHTTCDDIGERGEFSYNLFVQKAYNEQASAIKGTVTAKNHMINVINKKFIDTTKKPSLCLVRSISKVNSAIIEAQKSIAKCVENQFTRYNEECANFKHHKCEYCSSPDHEELDIMSDYAEYIGKVLFEPAEEGRICIAETMEIYNQILNEAERSADFCIKFFSHWNPPVANSF